MIIEINVQEMKENIDELKKDIQEQEEITNKIFNELKNSSFFWQDNIAMKFYDELDDKKNEFRKELLNLNDEIGIYEYLYNHYSKIGEKIKCKLSSKDYINSKLNNYINQLNRIINMYDSLDTSFCLNERYMIAKQRNKVKDTYNLVKGIKNNINDIYIKINEIEIEVAKKIARINVTNIEKFDDMKYLK